MWKFPLAPYLSQVFLALFALFALAKDWKAYASVTPFKSSSRGRHLLPVVIACLIFVLGAFSLTNIHDSRVASVKDHDTIESLARQISQAREENRNSATSVSNLQFQLELVDLSQATLDDFYRSIPTGLAPGSLLNAMDFSAKRAFFSRAFTFRAAQTKEQFFGGFALTFSDTPPLAIHISPCKKALDGECEPIAGVVTPLAPVFPTTFQVWNQNLRRSRKDVETMSLGGPGGIGRSTSHNVTVRLYFNPSALQRLREITGTLNLTTFQSVPSLKFVANPESVALHHQIAATQMKSFHDNRGGVWSVADVPDDVLEAAIAIVPRRVNVCFTFNLSEDLQSFFSYEREEYPGLAADGFVFAYHLVDASGVSANGPKVHADDLLKDAYHYAPRQQSVHP